MHIIKLYVFYTTIIIICFYTLFNRKKHFLHFCVEILKITYYNLFEGDKMAFKDQLSKLRKRKKITQLELSKMMGVKQYVVSSWEIGRSEPNISQIIKLSDILDVPTDYLLDKEVIRTVSEEDFEKVIRNIMKDDEDSFIKEIKSLCEDLSDKKKSVIVNIINDLKEY